MYNDLYEIWKREIESAELEQLPRDFYSRTTEYLRMLKEESRMLDKRTTKAVLLKKEMANAKRMLRELIRMRYRKLVKVVADGNKVPPNVLTIEEEKLFANVQPFADAFESFAKGILHGYLPTFSSEKKHERAVLRFMKDVPAIIGSDMKTYGPFKVEDIASLPFENVRILVKQGLAEKVEV